MDLSQLYLRAESLGQLTLSEVAQQLGLWGPLVFHKGGIGQLIEAFLGASAGSDAIPDFPHLGVELKTIPINTQGRVLESTYVSTVPLKDLHQVCWETSVVKAKLAHVLWVPIIKIKEQEPSAWRVGEPRFWQPNADEEAVLKQDFNELIDCIAMGELEQISARQGEYLHIRPKAADATKLTWGISKEGAPIKTLPRGFYLRSSVTQRWMGSCSDVFLNKK